MKEHLEILRKQASLPLATISIKNEYNITVKKRRKLLKYDRDRAAVRRKQLKKDIADGKTGAQEKEKMVKKAKHLSYLKRKKSGKVKDLKAKRRAAIKFQFIKDGLEKQKAINEYQVPWRKGKFTPLGAAIKLGDLKAVCWLLEKKASPTMRCTGSSIDRPLALAAWDNKPEVVQILLESGGLGANGESYGGLHGAIEHKMFKTIRRFLMKGCDLNEKYLNVTPLGASLTCGKTKTGDARLVKLLLNAKADVLGLTKMCSSPYAGGKLSKVFNVARTYSNSKCTALIEVAYSSASMQQ